MREVLPPLPPSLSRKLNIYVVYTTKVDAEDSEDESEIKSEAELLGLVKPGRSGGSVEEMRLTNIACRIIFEPGGLGSGSYCGM